MLFDAPFLKAELQAVQDALYGDTGKLKFKQRESKMSGCFGNSSEDKARERELNAYLKKTYSDPERRDEAIEARVIDKFQALPDLYRSRDGVKRYTNLEDAIGSLNQNEHIQIARAIRDGKPEDAGIALTMALQRILRSEAGDEIDEESEEVLGQEYERD
jgi:hypothetical protein